MADVELEEFVAYMPAHNYIYKPTREPWPAASVNGRFKPIPLYDTNGEPLLDDKGKPKTISASRWLDQNHPVEQATWCPGEPMLIANRLVADGGWIERQGVTTFNLYRPPTIKHGDPSKAGPWLALIGRVYPNDTNHIVKWLAHRVQRPREKINHALVLGGKPGIGKDSILEPAKRAIGSWNFAEVTPAQMIGRFNGFIKSVILRISEARDQGEMNKFQFYDHMKVFAAAPPDVIRCDEKNIREHGVFNVTGVIITTNYRDALYLPPDDRRHYVAWSDLAQEDFGLDEKTRKLYWQELYRWYDQGGDQHVAAYLATLDLSDFDPKAPPPKTDAFWDVVDRSRASEDCEIADALDEIALRENPPSDPLASITREHWPDAITVSRLTRVATEDFSDWLRDRRNRRLIPHRLERNGYLPIRNDGAKDGDWKIDGKRQRVYCKQELSIRGQIKAAQQLGKLGPKLEPEPQQPKRQPIFDEGEPF